jgi:hypothetical protein
MSKVRVVLESIFQQVSLLFITRSLFKVVEKVPHGCLSVLPNHKSDWACNCLTSLQLQAIFSWNLIIVNMQHYRLGFGRLFYSYWPRLSYYVWADGKEVCHSWSCMLANKEADYSCYSATPFLFQAKINHRVILRWHWFHWFLLKFSHI